MRPDPTPVPVDVRDRLSPVEFHSRYANRSPVLMRGAVAGMPAVSTWSLDRFASLAPDVEVRLKTGEVSAGATETMRLDTYARVVADWERRVAVGEEPGDRPAYLHDLPLLSLIPSLRHDLDGFPVELLPRFFRSEWWRFTQFFVGPTDSVTPLHFDSLLTHNIFLQISGSKRFTMVDPVDRDLCHTYDWRWSAVDPEDPDHERFPEFRHARVRQCVVEGGDVLYMPPGTLHKVTSLTSSVSFNIDWHDRTSALRGLLAFREGMPATNLRYNALFALGVIGGVPSRHVLPALRSYFSYIS